MLSKVKDDKGKGYKMSKLIKTSCKSKQIMEKQGRIHGNPVADGWAGAVMQKPLAILEIFRTDQRTNGSTDTARCRVAGP